MKYEALANAIFRVPGVDGGFLQWTEKTEQHSVFPLPGGGGEWQQGNRRTRTFRIVLHHGAQFAEVSSADMRTAVREAFAQAKIGLLEKIEAAQSLMQSTSERKPAPHLSTQDREAQAADFRTTVRQLVETIAILAELRAWLDGMDPMDPAGAPKPSQP